MDALTFSMIFLAVVAGFIITTGLICKLHDEFAEKLYKILKRLPPEEK